nr:hypothetical protein GCM10020092_021050 [Actinoplanes digitatis]
MRRALGDHDPATVAAGVVGVAGAAVTADPRIAAAFADEWAATGLNCPVTVVGDAVTAFAAGTAAPSGAVLIAGTGAVAARIGDRRVCRTADGLGWLLGDEGSGLWLGLRAVRAAARAWTGPVVPAASPPGSPNTPRWTPATPWCGGPVVEPPAAFAELAPLVCAAVAAGDPLAERLTAEAAARLVATLAELGPADGPVVLARRAPYPGDPRADRGPRGRAHPGHDRPGPGGGSRLAGAADHHRPRTGEPPARPDVSRLRESVRVPSGLSWPSERFRLMHRMFGLGDSGWGGDGASAGHRSSARGTLRTGPSSATSCLADGISSHPAPR